MTDKSILGGSGTTGATRLSGAAAYAHATAKSGDTGAYFAKHNITTSDPGVSDDNTQGWTGGASSWINTNSGVSWRCLSDATGAALWVRMGFNRKPPYVVNNYYLPRGVVQNGGAFSLTKNVQYLYPVVFDQLFSISALSVTVRSGSASTNFQCAVYGADASNKPTGLPLGKSAAGASSATTTSVATSLVANVPVIPGVLYYFSFNLDTSAAASFGGLSARTSANNPAALIGGTSVFTPNNGSVLNLGYYTTPDTYGAWSDLTGATFTSNFDDFMPVMGFKVGSVP